MVSEREGGGEKGDIYCDEWHERGGNPNEMARAPAGRFFISRTPAAAPQEPGLVKMAAPLVSVEPGSGALLHGHNLAQAVD